MLRLAPDTGGVAGLPASGVQAVSLNFTAIDPAAPNGYLQAWPHGSSPATEFSNVNWSRAGQTIAGGGIVRVTDGALDVAASASVHAAIDLNGYFTTG